VFCHTADLCGMCDTPVLMPHMIALGPPPFLLGTLEPSKKSFVINNLHAIVKVIPLEPLELTSAKNATRST
jgi:hypothetical protein